MPNKAKRVELIPEDDHQLILLRIDRVILIGLLLVLCIMTSVHTFGIVQNIKNDDQLVRDNTELRRELDQAQRVINNANNISAASVDFWRCAFLIEPDVKKTPPVIETCINQAKFPNGAP